MCKKLLFLISLVSLLGLAGSASAVTVTWTNEYPWTMTWDRAGNWDPVGIPNDVEDALVSPQYVNPLMPAVEEGQGPVIDSNARCRRILGPRYNSDANQTMWILAGDVLISGDRWIMADSGTGNAVLNIAGTANVKTTHDFRGLYSGDCTIDIGEDAVVDIGKDDNGWEIGRSDIGFFDVKIHGNADVKCRRARWCDDEYMQSDVIGTVLITDEASFDCDDDEWRGMRGEGDGIYDVTIDSNAYVHVDYELRFGDGSATVELNIEDNAVVEVEDQLRMGDGDSYTVIDVCDNATLDIGGRVRLGDGGGAYSIFNVFGGEVTIGYEVIYEDDGTGEVNIMGGYTYVADRLRLPNSGLDANLYVSGGTLDVDELRAPDSGYCKITMTDGNIVCRDKWEIGRDRGTLAFLAGGLVDMGEFDHTTNYLIDITGGMMKIDEDVYLDIRDEALAGRITGYGGCGGRGDLHIQYVPPTDNHTYVWATYNPKRAWDPSPVCGATVPPEVTLSWNSGDGATLHHIFLSWDLEDVNTGDLAAWQDAQPDPCNTYDTGPLILGLDYYWRIEEVNETPEPDEVTEGAVWMFTVEGEQWLDDMEGYTGEDPIWNTWWDGCGDSNGAYGNGTGSCLYTSTEIYHGDNSQSMMYAYDNTGQGITDIPPMPPVRDCNYSEATMTLDEPADWTLYGIRAVELYFFGHPGNDATELEAMYLKVTDTNDDSGYVVYGSKEPEQLSDMQVEDWELWAVDLAEFAAQSVNLDQVASIAIGFGDPTNCHREPGGAGVMYIDDLALRPKRCIPKYATSIFDTNGDCIVDELDLGQVVEDWLVDQQ